jgi:hypothetical protein
MILIPIPNSIPPESLQIEVGVNPLGFSAFLLPPRLSYVFVEFTPLPEGVARYGDSVVGVQESDFGSVGLFDGINVIHGYSLSRFSRVVIPVPFSISEKFSVYVRPRHAGIVAFSHDGTTYQVRRVGDPETVPVIPASDLTD